MKMRSLGQISHSLFNAASRDVFQEEQGNYRLVRVSRFTLYVLRCTLAGLAQRVLGVSTDTTQHLPRLYTFTPFHFPLLNRNQINTALPAQSAEVPHQTPATPPCRATAKR